MKLVIFRTEYPDGNQDFGACFEGSRCEIHTSEIEGTATTALSLLYSKYGKEDKDHVVFLAEKKLKAPTGLVARNNCPLSPQEKEKFWQAFNKL